MQLVNTPWMQSWTILELKYLHIELQMSSYVNIKAIKLITLFVGFAQLYKAPWDPPKSLNTSHWAPKPQWGPGQDLKNITWHLEQH